MALYAIGDPHLSLGSEKPMDIFGGAWNGYVEKLRQGFSGISENDTVVLCGDISWGMSLSESKEDFAFIESLPGKKILVKGNHDYWWGTKNKMDRFFAENGFHSLHILHNNCYVYKDIALCGTRGWFFEEDAQKSDQKIFGRELIRLESSLKTAEDKEKICFLHYPPYYHGYRCEPIIDLLEQYKVKSCYYGHLHGSSHRLAIQGMCGTVNYRLVAADYINFTPEKICD